MAANAVFVFEESDVLFGTLALLKLLINSVFPMGVTASMGENVVNGSLWQGETGAFLSLFLCQHGNLFVLGRQRALIRREPLLRQDHAVNHVCHKQPADIHLRLRAVLVSSPDVKEIVIGLIASRLPVGKRLLNRRAVKEGLNKIAAFSSILMIGKVRGNRHSMIL